MRRQKYNLCAARRWVGFAVVLALLPVGFYGVLGQEGGPPPGGPGGGGPGGPEMVQPAEGGPDVQVVVPEEGVDPVMMQPPGMEPRGGEGVDDSGNAGASGRNLSGSVARRAARLARGSEKAEPNEPTALANKLAAEPVEGADDGIRLNFKDAPLSQVLNYLSEAAGFVIVQEKEVGGTVSITSHQPISKDEVLDLLNSVLVEKGYAAIRNGRILKIVSRSAARTMDLPVRAGADPESIPKKDELVTQIIPVRYADASKLIENIRPLLEEDAALTANESSNAIVLTDTQTNIRRIAEIIKALDTSIASISAVRVFPLEYADASEVASVIQEVFSSSSSSSSQGAAGGFRAMMEQRFRMAGGGGRGGNAAAGTGTSEARQAASRVVAVADEYTNSLVVSAPDEVMPTIEQIVQQLDSNIADITEVRVFKLQFADATEMADMLNSLYYDSNNSVQSGRNSRNFGPPGFNRGGGTSTSQRSQRALLQSRVMAVGDPRTNTLIVSAAHETMMTIAETVGRLDSSSDKKQKVYVMPLEHADVDNVAEVLRGMFESNTTSSRSSSRTGSSSTGTSRLTQRVSEGASTSTTMNNSRSGGSGGTGGTR